MTYLAGPARRRYRHSGHRPRLFPKASVPQAPAVTTA
jgi:hypothetical protein